MVEKNYDPDNENCPEKEMIEELHLKKSNSINKNAQTAEEFIGDSPNRITKYERDMKQDSKSDTPKSDTPKSGSKKAND